MQKISQDEINNPEYKGKFVIVKVGAEWCTECRLLEPVLDGQAEKRPSMMFFKLDFEENEGFVEKYGIEKIPTLIAFKNGKEDGRWTEGGDTLDEWLDYLKW